MKKKGFASALRTIFSSGKKNEELIEDLEDILIEGDIGAVTAMEILEEVQKSSSGLRGREEFVRIVRDKLSDSILTEDLEPEAGKTNIIMMLGVNGVGKTTSLAKLGHYFRTEKGLESLLVAGDTFRAAAIDQLEEHGRRLAMRVIRQNPGADPGAVVYDGINSAVTNGVPLVLIDTAGRMHTKTNLVRELQKIDKVILGRLGDGVYRKILVIDATTGQNGLQQAEMFHKAVGLDGILLSKYDSASKGGIVISISKQLGIPFLFMGTGEKYGDLGPFDKERFLDILLLDE